MSKSWKYLSLSPFLLVLIETRPSSDSGSCDNLQTERSIIEYVNWPRLQMLQSCKVAMLQCCKIAKLQHYHPPPSTTTHNTTTTTTLGLLQEAGDKNTKWVQTNKRTNTRRDRWASWAAVAAKKTMSQGDLPLGWCRKSLNLLNQIWSLAGVKKIASHT